MTLKKSVILCFLGIIFSIANFLYGFLINRSEIHESNSCTIDSPYCKFSPYKKVVLLLVDSLKYEFIDPNLSKFSFYQGHLDIIRSLKKKRSKNVFISHFVSDPPTTTLQRIKGLTTGSFPTFVDIGSNFGSSELLEDSIINQWNQAGFNVKFVGDDTWTDLFPNKFNVSDPHPSFNIKDLDTVDRKVEEFILNSMKNKTSGSYEKPEIIIGHMLGIDHCGHTFGKVHHQMKRKLLELNELIKKIVDLIDKDTLFIMFGDHGMTKTGDHGGDSSEEVDAGLFLMSGKPLNARSIKPENSDTDLSQIDLVSTLAAMTGVAIPFSNLGVVRSNMLTSVGRANFYIDLNAQQVSKYVSSYEEKFGDLGFPSSIRKFLNNPMEMNNTEYKIKQLELIKEHFQLKWAQFTIPLIFGGISSFFLYIVAISNFLVAHQAKLENKKDRISVYLFYLSLNIIHFFIKDNYLFSLIFLIFIFVELYHLFKNRSFIDWSFASGLNLVIYIIGLLNLVVSFSNSFIVSEDKIMQFFLQTILLVKVIHCFVSIIVEIYSVKIKKFDRNITTTKATVKSNSFIMLLYIVSAFIFGSFCVKFGLRYKICREEQRSWCTSEQGSADKFVQFSIFLIPLIIILHRLWLKHCGNLTSTDCNALLIKSLLPFSGVCLFVFQAVQFADDSSKFSEIAEMVLLMFPRIIVISTLIVMIFLAIKPLLILYQKPYELNESIDVPSLYKYLRSTQSGDKAVTVYGLATVYSSLILTGLLSCCIFVSVFLKVQFVVGFISTIGILFSYSLLTNLCINLNRDNILSTFSISETVVFMFVLAQYGFFATGHQTTISNIPWYAVFIGWKNDHFTKIIPFIMLNINLFSAQIVITLFGLLLPLLILLISRGPANLFLTKSMKQNPDENCGDFHLFRTDLEGIRYRKWVQFYYVFYALYHSVVVFCVILSTGYSRRHLMAWKIFVPKMLYSVLNLLIIFLMTTLSYRFVLRAHRLALLWRSKNV